VKNQVDMLIIHKFVNEPAICAAGITKQLLRRARSDIWLAAPPVSANACGMEIMWKKE